MPQLTEQDAKEFRKAAKKFMKENTISREKARECLVRLGIYNKNGKLTKNYR